MKDKCIKSLSIAYEVSNLDLSKTNGNEDLSRKLTSNYPYWMKVVKVSLEVLELDNLNYLFLYNLVVIVNTSLTTIDDINSSWNNFINIISSSMEEFLAKNEVRYQKLN